ncbi:MAG: FAD-dependent oxidoreductase [Phycisphaeraceae bacterium]
MKTRELVRKVPVEDRYDVLVAGGGPAGTAAAISAARLGARVLLVEGTGCLGGMGTSGMVANWYALSDGRRMLVQGLFREVLETMHERGHLPPGVEPERWHEKLHGGMGFNAEGLKPLLDELCVQAGVEVRFVTRVIDAEADPETGEVEGVVINNIEGHRFVQAGTYIDATGDAVLADLCGAGSRRAGRDTEHIMPPTLCSVQANIDFAPFNFDLQQEKVHQALADGFFSQHDRHVPGLFRSGESIGILNAGHLFGTDALDARSLSDGYMWGRRLAVEYAEFLRRYMPGCERMETTATASLMGVRESRRIIGEQELTYDDFTARRHFPDQIGVYCKAVDIHVYDTSDEQWERYREEYLHRDVPGVGESYGLPYGILVPRGWRNLWVAGRCNSSDVKVNGAIRDQPACFLMGQAAGTAAVQSIRTGQAANTLDTATLIRTLREHGAYLPQPEPAGR